MPDYQHGKIYKLCSSADDQFYIGSTCSGLTTRLYNHRSRAAAKPNLRVYAHFNQVGWENVRIELVEDFPCANKLDLRQREQHHIDELQASLNSRPAHVHCPHGRQHQHCLDCNGAAICEHMRKKIRCKLCNPDDFMCTMCDRQYSGRTNLARHMLSRKHIMMVLLQTLTSDEEEEEEEGKTEDDE